MDVANASMYDGSTGTTEAVLMAQPGHAPQSQALISGGLHPQYRSIIETHRHSRRRLHGELLCLTGVEGQEDLILNAVDRDTSCVVVQTPELLWPRARLARQTRRGLPMPPARC
jgi:glycine dehydrogenase subunit 1